MRTGSSTHAAASEEELTMLQAPTCTAPPPPPTAAQHPPSAFLGPWRCRARPDRMAWSGCCCGAAATVTAAGDTDAGAAVGGDALPAAALQVRRSIGEWQGWGAQGCLVYASVQAGSSSAPATASAPSLVHHEHSTAAAATGRSAAATLPPARTRCSALLPARQWVAHRDHALCECAALQCTLALG